MSAHRANKPGGQQIFFARRAVGNVAARVASWARRSTSASTAASTALAPLTPEFSADQHRAYVEYLNGAIEDPKVRNIALTGRYGSGKSSILEHFAAQPTMTNRVLPLALSTLGPQHLDSPLTDQVSGASSSTTNRIQKELVKQLLHREKPSRLRQSRYQRIDVLSKSRTVLEAAALVAVLAALLWALGALPNAFAHQPWPIRGIAAVAIVALIAWGRLAFHSRFSISELSAAGASISLTTAGSYFDEYLDEIVYFFETAIEVDVVLFEDLDRFNDPGIFEGLRELNTLLNSTKQMGDRTIRFVYALRDSVFEKLGGDGVEDSNAFHTATARANRTKFFDLAIPIVPFITHRNARDLLTRILQDDQHGVVIPVSPALIDLTARHNPDMRLLTNIRNEYAVYSRRLITERNGVESLQPDQLFALIVYKNIHLADFEDMLLGRSRLDDLYRYSRQLVTEAMSLRRTRLRQLADQPALRMVLATKSKRWGDQLAWHVEEILKARSAAGGRQCSLTGYKVADTAFDVDAASGAEFWRTIAVTGKGIGVVFNAGGYGDSLSISHGGLARLLQDELSATEWERAEHSDLASQRAQIQNELEVLRTADFAALIEHPKFTISIHDEQLSFSEVLTTTIQSELGRALIASGYIDRYYALYVAQYYGVHVPPNALNYIRQNVDTNRTDANYPLTDDEIAAVLRETNGAFLADKSAYNVAVVDYLFAHDDPKETRVRVILDAATRQIGDDEQEFLNSYFVDGVSKNAAATYLASRWPRTFVYLATECDLTVESRLALVSAALAGASPDVSYEFNDALRSYLQDNHHSLPIVKRHLAPDDVIDQPIPKEQVRRAVEALNRAGVVFGDLSELSSAAIEPVIEGDLYALTNANLRTVLGENPGLSLDSIAAINKNVYEDCLQRSDEYLTALSSPAVTKGPSVDDTPDLAGEAGAAWTIERASAFAGIVTDLVASSGEVPLPVLVLAHPDCVVEDLGDVPTKAWPALAEALRISPTLANVDSYVQELGEVDAALAANLTSAGQITALHEGEADEDDAADSTSLREMKSRVAAAILKARETIPDPALRVALATSVGLGEWFALSEVEPEQGSLLGHLVGADIWIDESALVAHFSNPDWATLRFAIQESSSFADYMNPAVLNASMAAELLLSPDISDYVKRAVLDRFDEFVDVGSSDALRAAGTAALSTGTPLTVVQIAGIAAGTDDADLVIPLLDALGGSIAGDEIVNTLAQLSSPYNELAQPGAKLTFPRDAHHEAVLKRVHVAGLITARSRPSSIRKPARIEVIVK